MRKCLLSFALFVLTVSVLWAEDVKILHERYMQASISHDVETLRALTAEDATWQLGPRLLAGREAVVSPNEWDAGTLTELEYRDVRIAGNVVEFTLLERNEVLRAIGIEVAHHYTRFIFEDGKVRRKEAWQPSSDMAEVIVRMQPLRDWIREKQPEALEILMDGSGTFVFSQEGGALMKSLAQEWVKAGRPSLQ